MSMKNTPSVVVALALLAGAPAAALADGIVPSVGKGVGAVVEGTGEALFGTDDKDRDTVVIKEQKPDVVVTQQRPAVVVAEPAPAVAVVEKRPVVVEKRAEPKPDVQVNVNN